ncbi:MAG: hypothetical protein ACJA1B_002587 [Polaribacter sp.]|jgi:hypothetical protein
MKMVITVVFMVNIFINKYDKPIVLVESEKTAIVCAINFPDYNWLSYGGIIGMTNDKMKVLSGKTILIVPDLSENARNIVKKKAIDLKELQIDAKTWDLSKGMNDDELKEKGYFNCDLEDFLKKMVRLCKPVNNIKLLKIVLKKSWFMYCNVV